MDYVVPRSYNQVCGVIKDNIVLRFCKQLKMLEQSSCWKTTGSYLHNAQRGARVSDDFTKAAQDTHAVLVIPVVEDLAHDVRIAGTFWLGQGLGSEKVAMCEGDTGQEGLPRGVLPPVKLCPLNDLRAAHHEGLNAIVLSNGASTSLDLLRTANSPIKHSICHSQTLQKLLSSCKPTIHCVVYKPAIRYVNSELHFLTMTRQGCKPIASSSVQLLARMPQAPYLPC
jgi:hypothetical protein